MNETAIPSPRQFVRIRRQTGFTLIELMVAITLSLIILAALSVMFVTSSRARDEITRANQQIENGRYAMQVLSDDLRLAGFYGGFLISSVPIATPSALPNPCSVPSPLPTTSNNATLEGTLTLPVQGYDNGTNPIAHCGSATFSTLTGYKVGTDIVVVRRASSCKAGPPADADPDCDDIAGELYFQASQCNAELTDATQPKYRLSTNTFDRHKKGSNCSTAPAAVKRRFLTHVYYIAEVDHDGDATTAVVPTLMRAELMGGNFSTKTPLAEGIEQLQLEYGIDDSGADGVPDNYTSNPDSYNGCAGPAVACSPTNWANVMAVKIHLLARSTDPSPGHTDTKAYTLGNNPPITPGGSYKRHVFEATVRLSNPAGLRQK